MRCIHGKAQYFEKCGVEGEQLIALITVCIDGGGGLCLRTVECVTERGVLARDSMEPAILLISDGHYLDAYSCRSLGGGDGGGVDVPKGGELSRNKVVAATAGVAAAAGVAAVLFSTSSPSFSSSFPSSSSSSLSSSLT